MTSVYFCILLWVFVSSLTCVRSIVVTSRLVDPPQDYDCEIVEWMSFPPTCTEDCTICEQFHNPPDNVATCVNYEVYIYPGEGCDPDDLPSVQCGLNCVEVDHCADEPCGPGFTCINLSNDFDCEAIPAEVTTTLPDVDGIRRCVTYTIHSDTATWDESTTTCENDGGYLAKIIDSRTQQLLNTNLDPLNAYWLGGNDKITEGTWVYGDSKSDKVCYNNWETGVTPQNDNEDCALLKWNNGGFVWEDEVCSMTANYICSTSQVYSG
ncbi:brevican core protein-like [Saccoglossus kowalevskii]|uniref:Aggrecan core protein-like n=1 Tax=Saccoglossus kowalevskii TaxID=10224 RepID=A0ABM0GSV2_SACKO|nr:PREDICTED: aggrecan core protein-like [Saccoglossus kowalevskii]